MNSTDREMKSDGRVSLTVCPHGHDDDAGLGDDVLGELVEGGVGVVVEALQLLHHVVQLEKRPEGLAVGAAVHRRGVKLEDGVVLTQSLLDKLRDGEQSEFNWREAEGVDSAVFFLYVQITVLTFFKQRQKK